jgi:hypothetical protein
MPRNDPQKTKEEIKAEKEAHNRKTLISMKHLLEANKVEDFAHLFSLYGRSNFATAIHMGQQTLKQKIANPAAFKANEMEAIANLIGVDYDIMSRFWMEQIARSKRSETK